MSAVEPGVYKAILRVRAAYPFDIGCFLMRFLLYMNTIGTVTMLTLSGYSFFIGGLVSSAIALATFLISPRVSKLVDTYGQSRVVPWAAAVTVLGVFAMVAMVLFRAPEWCLFVAAVLMGFSPNAPALARTRWTYLIRSGRLGDSAPDLRTMFSYQSVMDDIGFMISPSLSIALASAITPVAGMMFGGIAYAAGCILLILSKTTEPQPGWDEGFADAEAGSDGEGEAGREAFKHRKSVFRTSSVVRVLFMLLFFVGAFFGVFDTATVALAEEMGDPTAASIILMASGVVSMAMGFVFGMVRIGLAQHVQLVLFAVLIGCGYGTMMFIDSIPSLFVVATVAAIFYAPFLIVANATCERAVPGDRLTEAITWMNAGSTCGMALGPTLGGVAIDYFGAIASFDAGAVLALAIPVTALCFYRMLKRNLRESEVRVVRTAGHSTR